MSTKIIGFSKAKNMVKLNDGSGEVWYWLTPRVQQFISNLGEGMDVDFEVEEKQGKKIINFIKQSGQGPSQVSTGFSCSKCGATLKDDKYPTCYTCSMKEREAKALGKSTEKSIGFVCADCGAPLKDNTYETCYKCSMAKREKEGTSPQGRSKDRTIRAEAIGHMVSRTLIGLQGTYDINNVGELIKTLFDHYDKGVDKLEG